MFVLVKETTGNIKATATGTVVPKRKQGLHKLPRPHHGVGQRPFGEKQYVPVEIATHGGGEIQAQSRSSPYRGDPGPQYHAGGADTATLMGTGWRVIAAPDQSANSSHASRVFRSRVDATSAHRSGKPRRWITSATLRGY